MSKSNGLTHRLMIAASFGVIAVASAGLPEAARAQAQAQAVSTPTARDRAITVPAMSMAEALEAIAAQSGQRIDYDPDAVRSLVSQPVAGARSVREAIDTAVGGTDLAVMSDGNGGFSVVNAIVVRARRDEAETSLLVRQASTSDRNGLSLREQPRNTQIISAKAIDEQQALDIAEVLRNAGGVSVQTNNPNTGANYTVRGFSAAGLVNGLAGGSQYGVASGANQPIANIERVEILKGPDALVAGFGNLGGNVNVVTRKPSADRRVSASFDTGSFGLVRGVLDVNGAISSDRKLSGRLIQSAQNMDRNYGGYTGNEDYLIAPSLRFKDARTDFLIGASFSKAISGIGAYTLFDNRTREIIERDPSVPIYSPDQGIRVRTDRYYFDLTREIIPGLEFVARGLHDENDLKLQVYQLGYNRAGLRTIGVGGSQQQGKSDALDAFLRMEKTFGGAVTLRLNAGYNYSDGFTEQRSSRTFTVVNNPPLGENTTFPVIPFSPLGPVQFRTEGSQEGVYGQALVEFWRVKLLGGVRKNWFSTKASFFFPGAQPQDPQEREGTSPSAGIIFDATDTLSIFANYSRGVQAIFNLDRDGNFLPNITTTNKEAGIKLDLFGERATINASYFDIMQDNIIVFDPVDRQFTSRDGQRGRGFDLNIAGQVLPGLTILGSLTRTEYDLLTPTAFATSVPRQPRDTYSVYANYRTDIADGVIGGGSIGLFGRSSSFADLLGQYVVPASRQVDVNGFVSFSGFDVNLGIRNIFDRRNYNTTSVITYVPVDEPRNFRLSISKRFF